MGERVEFVGECDEAALNALYDESSVFVLPSYFEGYGMVLTEALARGLPIVSTTAGAIPDTVPPEAGVLVAPGDEEASRRCSANCSGLHPASSGSQSPPAATLGICQAGITR